MEQEEVVVKIAEYGKEIGSLKHRVSDLEKKNEAIMELTLSVRELATNMSHMMKEQKEQGERLNVLEEEPNRVLAQVKASAITAIVTVVVSAVVTTLIYTMAQGV